MMTIYRLFGVLAFVGFASVSRAQMAPQQPVGEVGGAGGVGANIIQICQCIENQPVSNCQQLADPSKSDPNRAVAPNATPAGHGGPNR